MVCPIYGIIGDQSPSNNYSINRYYQLPLETDTFGNNFQAKKLYLQRQLPETWQTGRELSIEHLTRQFKAGEP